LLFFREKV